MYDAPAPEAPKGARWRVWLRRVFRAMGRLLLAAPFGHRQFRNEDGSRTGRFLRSLTYRLAFAPLLLVIFLTAIVIAATHPGRSTQEADPLSFGVYYDPANFLTDDGVHFPKWLATIADAIAWMRTQPNVDPNRIALIGLGTGANACAIAARNDPSITAMVLAAPVSNFDQAFADRVGSNHRWLGPLHNLFRWTFETMYGVDASDLDMSNFQQVIAQRHVLMTDRRQRLMDQGYIGGVRRFLDKHFHEQVASAK